MSTLGKTSIGADGYWESIASGGVFIYTATAAQTGRVSSISFYGAAPFGSTTYIKPVIYNTSNVPIANGVGNAVLGRSWGQGFGWQTATYTTKPTIYTGTTYRIAIIINNNYIIHYDDQVLNNTGGLDSYVNPDGLDSVYGLDHAYSIYLTYTQIITKVEGITPGKLEGISWADVVDVK